MQNDEILQSIECDPKFSKVYNYNTQKYLPYVHIIYINN